MMARPPAFSTAVAMVSSSQAATTGPSLAASARRSTCAIIGRPAISANGVSRQPGRGHPGRRAGGGEGGGGVEGGGGGWGGGGPVPWGGGVLYGLPETRKTGYLCAAAG